MKHIFLIWSICLFSSCMQSTVECEDVLLKYAEKHQHLEFIDCKKGNGQTVLETKYKVSGKHAEDVEKSLIEKYGMGKLKFTCCGWESTNGKHGVIENEALQNRNKNYNLVISMYGNAEKENENGEMYIEPDRTKLDFYVIVKLLDI